MVKHWGALAACDSLVSKEAAFSGIFTPKNDLKGSIICKILHLNNRETIPYSLMVSCLQIVSVDVQALLSLNSD